MILVVCDDCKHEVDGHRCPVLFETRSYCNNCERYVDESVSEMTEAECEQLHNLLD